MIRRPLATTISALAAGALAATALPAQALPVVPVPGTDLYVSSVTNYTVPDQGLADSALADFTCNEPTPLPRRPRGLNVALDLADKVLASTESVAALTKIGRAHV